MQEATEHPTQSLQGASNKVAGKCLSSELLSSRTGFGLVKIGHF